MELFRRPLVLVVVVCLSLRMAHAQVVGENVAYRPGQCLSGDKHKEAASPEPEGPEYVACHQWRDNACCTAEFTQQLQHANVTNIDGFHWNRCGDLSERCQQFFVEIECFYRCSPNVAHWANTRFDSALANLPVCREYCDEWFDACADDLTCVDNWITDWVLINDQNYCPDPSVRTCQTYREVYGDGAGICRQLWGESFFRSEYSQLDPDRQCMTITWNETDPNPNTAAIRNMFDEAQGSDEDGNGGSRVAAVTYTLVLAMTLLGMAWLR